MKKAYSNQVSAIKEITLGLELECVRTTPNAFELIDRNNFGKRTDSSILNEYGERLPTHGIRAGVELVTPILKVNADLRSEAGLNIFEFDYRNVSQVVKDLTSCADYVNSSCGIHLHLGRPNGDNTDWNPRRLENFNGGLASEWKPGHVRNMLLIGLALEDKLYSVVPESRKQCRHCRRINEVYGSADIMAYYPVGTPLPRKQDNTKRYCWMNLIETRRQGDPNETRIGYSRSKGFGTIEIRMLGETKNYDYVLSWVKLWTHIAMAVAYLPSETAALYCIYSSWLQPFFDKLNAHKERHERTDATTNRIRLPNEIVQNLTTEDN